jgi:hypothetical protein
MLSAQSVALETRIASTTTIKVIEEAGTLLVKLCIFSHPNHWRRRVSSLMQTSDKGPPRKKARCMGFYWRNSSCIVMILLLFIEVLLHQNCANDNF